MSDQTSTLLESVVLQAYDIGAVKLGSFKLKSGIVSPIYFDLRVMVSYPQVLQQVVDLIWSRLKQKSDDFVCGVPYTALPIASILSIQHNVRTRCICYILHTFILDCEGKSFGEKTDSFLLLQFPMVVCRKERKEHGTGKDVEGIYHAGQTSLVVRCPPSLRTTILA